MAGLLFQVIPTCLVFRAADAGNELISSTIYLFIFSFTCIPQIPMRLQETIGYRINQCHVDICLLEAYV
jgi:hypothetical protein